MELLNNIASSPDPLHQVDIDYKRPMAYAKMETLVKEMQDRDDGVPVRSQKLFLSSIPAAFAGYDIIEWLMERLSIEDSVEAIHMANLLCQHGYFFPVSSSNNPQHCSAATFSVKDDSSLYRFQTPYYWPNKALLSQDSNVEYAIYLSKRTLRSKQKHALDDYELDALNQLKRSLGNKWDFVTMQADEQVRLSKERRKQDKLVQDSQERAYWRVLRPPPGAPSCVEIPPYNQRTSVAKPLRKTNNLLLEDLRNEVELLRNSCIRTRIKVSCALESLANFSETHHEHDAFLVSRLPSNPWHSDDVTFWVLNTDLVEVPSERRLRKWTICLEELIADPAGLREFENYLKKEYCHENIRFWLAVREMRFGPTSLLRHRAQQIYNEFLCPGSPCEINIDMRTMEAVQKELNYLVPSRFTFDPAAEHVYVMLLKKDCYPRYIRSDCYKNLLSLSRHQGSKLNCASKRLDKFLSFVSDRGKKKSSLVLASSTAGATSGDLDSSRSSTKHESDINDVPYRGDMDKSLRNLSRDDSLEDACCPWESSSDRTTSTTTRTRNATAKPVEKALATGAVAEKPVAVSTTYSAAGSAIATATKSTPTAKQAKVEAEISSLVATTTTRSDIGAGSSRTTVGLGVKQKSMDSESDRKVKGPTAHLPLATSKSAEMLLGGQGDSSSPSPPPHPSPPLQAPLVDPEQTSTPPEGEGTPPDPPTVILITEKSLESQPSSSSRAKLLKEKSESLEICPWECPESETEPSETFTKTYSTLGYL